MPGDNCFDVVRLDKNWEPDNDYCTISIKGKKARERGDQKGARGGSQTNPISWPHPFNGRKEGRKGKQMQLHPDLNNGQGKEGRKVKEVK